MSSAGQFLPSLLFELRYQLRQPLFASVAGVLFLLAFGAMASERVTVGGGTDNLHLNGNFVIIQSMYVFSILGMFVATAFVSAPVVRDFEARTAELMLSTPVSRASYLGARLLAGYLACLLAVSAALFGTLVATFMPWLDQERVMAFSLAPYWHSLWAVLVPNLLITSGLFFAATALTRTLAAGWITALALLVFYAVVAVNSDAETIALTSVLDPFGVIAFSEHTRYWTVFDRNTQIPDMAGALLYSRLFWLGLTGLAMALGYRLFRFRLRPTGRRWGKRGTAARSAEPGRPELLPAAPMVMPAVNLGANTGQQFLAQWRMDMRGVIGSAAFWAVLAFGIFNALGGVLASLSTTYGTPLLPVTGILVGSLEGSFSLSLLLVVLWFAGELVHRERSHRVDELVGACAVPPWVPLLSKTLALLMVVVLMLIMATLTAVLVQISKGFYDLQPMTWFWGVFSSLGMDFYLLAVLAVFLQVLVRNRFVGMGLLILVFIGDMALGSAGFQHNLYRFNVPALQYSDMNGLGHFLKPHLWFAAYWLVFCGLLLMLGHLLQVPSRDGRWPERLQAAQHRLTIPVRAGLVVGVVGYVALGSWIFWNTNVLNTWQSDDARELAQANYELRYGKFRGQRIPDVVDMDISLDIYPGERRLRSRGRMLLRNTSDAPMSGLHYSLAAPLEVQSLTVTGAEQVAADEELGYYQLQFAEPLAPGAETLLEFDLSWDNPGFVVRGSSTRLVANGTFVDITEVAPLPGYNSRWELADNNIRRRHGLPPAERQPEYGSPGATDVSEFGVASRSGFRTVVSTSADQVAVAPGYLQRSWQEQGRNFFEYSMDVDIWPFVSWQSARYSVARDQWQDVALEVYHHPAHVWNVEPMLRAAKKGLAYFSTAFSPYQYRQFRIQEFPGYETFAQSFPNTIPFSENIGFIADLSDPKEIDYVFYVTAHELAHQWWAHQVLGAKQQGASLIVETLAQYSALMLMEQEYGREQMRRFLKYEGDRYLAGRGGEQIEELPLRLVEGQGYIHYRKGSLVMYALKDYLGEDQVNLALRNFLARYANQGPPFPASGDLIDEFRKVAGPGRGQQLITDLFEHISLWDLAVTSTSSRPLAAGRWQVELTIKASQYRADGAGEDAEVPMDMDVEIGVFAKADSELATNALPPALYLAKHPLRSGEQTLVLEVTGQPDRVAVDPLNILIDRQPGDNIKSL